MPWFHATFRKHLDSIRSHGLGGTIVEKNWNECDDGVHLATNPAVCLLVMFEHYARFGDPESLPREHLKEIVVIVVDDSRVDARLLAPDPEIDRDDVRIYCGVIDVTGMPVLAVDEVVAGLEELPSPPVP
jgi:hypothetical protein